MIGSKGLPRKREREQGRVEVAAMAETVIGWIATGTTLVMFTGSLGFIFGREGVLFRKNTDNLATGFPFFMTFFNCLAWSVYATKDLSLLAQPFAANTYGALVNLTFLSVYWYYTKTDKQKCLVYFGTGCSVTALVFAIAFFWLNNLEVIGYYASGCAVLMYSAPLAAIGEVYRTKSIAKMPLLPLLGIFSSSILWLVYAFMVQDIPIIIPNALGVLFGTIQLSVYFYYSCVYSKESTEQADSDFEKAIELDDDDLLITEQPALQKGISIVMKNSSDENEEAKQRDDSVNAIV